MFTDDQTGQYRVTVLASDRDDDQCHCCCEPLLLSIEHLGPEADAVQFCLPQGRAEVDKLIGALTAARHRHRCTRPWLAG